MLRLGLGLRGAARTPLARRGGDHLSRSSLARALCSKAGATAAGAAESTKDTPGAEPGPSGDGEDSAARVTQLEQQVAGLDEQLKSKHDHLLRALADSENIRRRAAIDVENASKYAVGGFAKDLLDVADNLGRAMGAVPENMRESDEHQDLKMLYEGVQLTDNLLLKVFTKHGLKKMEPMGEKFDPNFHNAMFEAPDPSKEPGTVMHVATPGYKLHDRCLRAANVGVVRKPS
jgi:molecular chaperone GrpE